MNLLLIFKIISLATLCIFIVPRKFKYSFALLLQILLTGVSSYWAIEVFNHSDLNLNLGFSFWSQSPKLGIDKLSSYFILLINFICLIGFSFARGYLAPYLKNKSDAALALHFFSFIGLHLAMLLVVMARDGMFFLVVWELMSLFSFLLVIFEGENTQNIKAGINYLIQMHLAFFFLLLAFIGLEQATGISDFSALPIYFKSINNLSLFTLFFIGFGFKAGFVPLHTWLPMAHPAAPSHVSGVMSGVMIKIGIYGIIRILMNIQSNQFIIGSSILILSIASGIYAITTAVVQSDIKKLLAYSSIENISIIGIGLGMGTIGLSTHNSMLTILGFGASLLHVLNHSIIKSLLFFTAGKVISACKTQNIEDLGGIIKKMPITSGLFLLGSLSICALPPFNGFVSEFVLFTGLINGVQVDNISYNILFITSILGLAVISGLSIFAFTKLFGIAFLGTARSNKPEQAKETKLRQMYPLFLLAGFIVIIGLLPLLFIKPIMTVIESSFGINTSFIYETTAISSLISIGKAGGALVLIIVTMLILRSLKLKNSIVRYGAGWACGYTAGNSKHQYTSASFSDYFTVLTGNMVNIHKKMKPIAETEIFPNEHSFSSNSEDPLKILDDMPVRYTEKLLKQTAILQTGEIQHYILYALLFMVILLIISLLGII